MKVIGSTKARTSLYKLIDETCVQHAPIKITSKKGNAILIGEKDWESIEETLFLLNIPGMRDSIKKGMAESNENCHKELPW